MAPPEALAPTVIVFDPLAEKVPLAPLDGAVNVTALPATWVVSGQPFVFASVTWNMSEKGECSLLVCGVPPASVNSFGGFAVGQASAAAGAGPPKPAKVRPATTAGAMKSRRIGRWCSALIMRPSRPG